MTTKKIQQTYRSYEKRIEKFLKRAEDYLANPTTQALGFRYLVSAREALNILSLNIELRGDQRGDYKDKISQLRALIDTFSLLANEIAGRNQEQ